METSIFILGYEDVGLGLSYRQMIKCRWALRQIVWAFTFALGPKWEIIFMWKIEVWKLENAEK